MSKATTKTTAALRKRSIQRLSEDMAQKHRFVEVSLEKTLGASQVEERLTNRLEEGVRGIQYASKLHTIVFNLEM